MPFKIATHADDRGSLIFPSDSQFQAKKAEVVNHQYPRGQLAEILESYNRSLGVDSTALESIKKINKEESVCIITGQQLGFMSGPSLTILKALTALHFAKKFNAIPIFWLATEDHDHDEIDHTFLVDSLGNLKRYRLAFPRNKLFVEDLVLTKSHLEVIASFLEDVQHPEQLKSWKPKLGELYSKAMAQHLALLFRGTGLVFLEPKLLRPLAKDFFQKEIQEAKQIHQILLKAPPGILKFDKEETNLYFKNEKGERLKITCPKKGEFVIGEKDYSKRELLNKIEESPENFSTNVASRPVLQNHLIPTLAYIAGPTEMDYHKQLKEYHEYHQTIMPLIIPRISATLLPAKATEILEKVHLHPWEINRKTMKADDILPKEIHYLHNLIHPQNMLQERVLNWWGFQADFKENLIRALLDQIPWGISDYYIFNAEPQRHRDAKYNI
jgi:bacillithiol biosynthesis cysteine-adding enzyme BshC